MPSGKDSKIPLQNAYTPHIKPSQAGTATSSNLKSRTEIRENSDIFKLAATKPLAVNVRDWELRSHVDQRFTNVEGTLRLHNWMLGTILGFIVAVFFKVFSH